MKPIIMSPRPHQISCGLNIANSVLCAGVGVANIGFMSYYILGGLSLFSLYGGTKDFIQAKQIKKTWKDIRNISPVTVDRNKLPKKEGQVYIGTGFQWDIRHVEKYYQYSKLDSETLKLGKNVLGGSPIMHGMGANEEKDFFIEEKLLNVHSLFLGTTGVGKTRALEILAIQAIERILRGECVVIIDPKGDSDLLNLVYNTMIYYKMEQRFRFFSLAHPTISCKYNPLENYVKASDIADRIAPLMGDGGGNSKTFIDYCWGVINDIAQLLNLLGMPMTLKNIDKYALKDQSGLLREALIKLVGIDAKMLQDDDKIKDAATKFKKMVSDKKCEPIEPLLNYIELATRDRDNYGKMVNSLKPLMSQLSAGEVGDLLCPDSKDTDVFSWSDTVEKGGLTYMYLGSLMNEITATAVGKLTLLDLKAKVGEIYALKDKSNFKRINIFIDELSQIVVPELVALLNQGRGAGVAMTLFTQTIADLESKLTRPIAEQILENCNNKYQLRNQKVTSSELFTTECGNVTIDVVSDSKNLTPGFGNTGNQLVGAFAVGVGRKATPTEVPKVSSDMIGTLPIGQAFCNIAAVTYKIRFPLFKPVPEDVHYLKMRGVIT